MIYERIEGEEGKDSGGVEEARRNILVRVIGRFEKLMRNREIGIPLYIGTMPKTFRVH